MKFDKLTQKARESLEKAQQAVSQLHQSQLDSEHLLYGITYVDGSIMPSVFAAAGIDEADAKSQVRKLVERGQVLDDNASGSTAQIYLTPDAADILKQAEDEMEQMG
ncbi:hypothetical protein KDL30_15710, partial [bacterium]|nr:hypothetical protein [bacterium]